MSSSNPSNFKGNLQQQNWVVATIVDVDRDSDGPKDGSVKVKFDGEHGDEMGGQDLQWVKHVVNGETQMRQHGKWPPHQYQVGERVLVMNMGQQGWMILGSTGNSEKDDQRRDMHHEADNASYMPWSDMGGEDSHPWARIVQGKSVTELPPDPFGQFVYEGPPATPPQPEDGVASATQKTPNANKYGKRIAQRLLNKEKRVGESPYPGDPNATTFSQNIGAEEQVKNAYNMIEQLKQTAQGDLNIPMPDALGGMGNIMGALASIAAFMSQVQQGSKKEDKKTIRDQIFAMYTRATGLQPLDIYGNETPTYIAYEKKQLVAMGYDENYLAEYRTNGGPGNT